jgi:hypothetical protein
VTDLSENNLRTGKGGYRDQLDVQFCGVMDDDEGAGEMAGAERISLAAEVTLKAPV